MRVGALEGVPSQYLGAGQPKQVKPRLRPLNLLAMPCSYMYALSPVLNAQVTIHVSAIKFIARCVPPLPVTFNARRSFLRTFTLDVDSSFRSFLSRGESVGQWTACL